MQTIPAQDPDHWATDGACDSAKFATPACGRLPMTVYGTRIGMLESGGAEWDSRTSPESPSPPIGAFQLPPLERTASADNERNPCHLV